MLVSNDLWCHSIQYTLYVLIFDSKENESYEILYVYPGQILLSITNGTPDAEVKRQN